MSGWADRPSPQFERKLLQYHWRALADWTPQRWNLTAVAVHDGRIIGVQDVGATDFSVARSVSTGSWLGRSYQGRGLAKEMRAAILHLAFEGLGARTAYSGAWEENAASLGVSRALGYEPNGTVVRARGELAAVQVNLRLDRAEWATHRRSDIEITGLAECMEFFVEAESEPAG